MSALAPAAAGNTASDDAPDPARLLRLPRRWWSWALIAIVGLIVIAVPASSWILSSVLLDPHENLAAHNLKVLSASAGDVTLARTPASMRPGTYGRLRGASARVPLAAGARTPLTAPRGRPAPGAERPS